MRLILAAFIALWPTLGFAECSGPGLHEQLSEQEVQRFDTRVAAIPHGNGLIWHGRKGAQALTLIGTMHLPDPRHAHVYEQSLPTIEGADMLLVEAGPDEIAKLEHRMATDPEVSFRPDGPTLPELLSPEDWQRVREAASSHGIPSFLAAKMQPWVLSMALAIPPCVMRDMTAGGTGLDGMLMTAAQENDTPIVALEPWDTAITLFQNDPLEEQLTGLRAAAMSEELTLQAYISLGDYYFAQNSAAVMEISHLAMERVPDLTTDEVAQVWDDITSELLVARNRAWLPKIESAAQDGRIAVAVGAGHLQGEEGLVSLLEAHGWEMSPEIWPQN